MSQFVRETVGKYVLPGTFLLCFLLSAILFVEYLLVGKFANDFGVYWRVANHPVSEAYAWQGRYPFPYMPTMLFWVQFIKNVPLWLAYATFTVISVGTFAHMVRHYLPRIAVALCMVSPPFVRGTMTGQVSTLLYALMLWAVGTEKRVAAGITFGLIASVKPQLVAMAPLMFVLNRDGRAFLASGLSLVAIAGLSTIIFGPDRWSEWIASMPHFRSMVVDTNVIVVAVTPYSIAEFHGLPPLPFLLAGTLCGAAVVYLCRNAEPLEKATAIGLGSLMASPYALAYDLIVVIPFLALMVTRGRLLSAFAMAAVANPLPIILAAYELLAPKLLKPRQAVDFPASQVAAAVPVDPNSIDRRGRREEPEQPTARTSR